MKEFFLLIIAQFHLRSCTKNSPLCCDRCELTYLHDLPKLLNCLSHCIYMHISSSHMHMCMYFVNCVCSVAEALCISRFLALCVLNRALAPIMHVTSQPIKPLLTGAPLSVIFHRSECEISRIG